jgi:hypothetical protein
VEFSESARLRRYRFDVFDILIQAAAVLERH